MLKQFSRDRRAAVLPIFAIALIPLIVAVGAVIDYSRAYQQRTVVQDSMDSAALAAGKKLGIWTSSQLTTEATNFFTTNVGTKVNTMPTLTPTITSTTLTLKTQLHVPTYFLGLIGLNEFVFNLTSQTTVSTTRLRVALVLDNTGSMASDGKLTALKTATKNLLTQLQGIAISNGDVYVSIIPFVKDVNLGTYSSSWASWMDWSLTAPTDYSVPDSGDGPGSTCPWTSGGGFGGFGGTTYNCATTLGGSTAASTIPSSGTWKGDFCPKGGMGCYDSVASTSTSSQVVGTGSRANCNGYSNCSCTGNSYNKVCTATITSTSYSHTWFVDPTKWSGCVTDRGASLASSTTTGPDQTVFSSSSTTPFSAEDYSACPQAMQSLTYNWTTLNTLVDNMAANGSTNQPIGLVWGWQSLVGGGPMTAPTMDPAFQYQQIIILLSDGLNTQDRWYGNGSNTSTDVDKRMYYKTVGGTVSGTCANVKATGITIYSVQVNTGGDPTSTLLQDCASDSTKFFELKTSDAIITTFNAIGTQLSQLRIAM